MSIRLKLACGEFIGETGEIPCQDITGKLIKNGDRVRIPKGAVIRGTFPEPHKISKISHVVRVIGADSGYNRISPHRDDVARPPEVCWAGAGGYWHYTDSDGVELRDGN